MWIDISLSTIPPATLAFGFGRWCFFTIFTFSTTTRSLSSTFSTEPRRPLSLPAITTTSSPFLILFIVLLPIRRSEHFRRQRNDAHERLGAQLAGHRSEDAGTDRLELVGQKHRGVAVELDDGAVRTADAALGAHHYGVVDLALLNLAARDSVTDADLDDVADAGIAALGAAQHLDAFEAASAAVVGGFEHGAHLDHDCCPRVVRLLHRGRRGRAFHHLHQRPRLVARDGAALGDLHDVALVAGVLLVVRLDLGAAAQDLAVGRVRDHTRDGHRAALA